MHIKNVLLPLKHCFVCLAYCLQTIFDTAKGRDVFGERQVILREQLQTDEIDSNHPDWVTK